MEKLLSIEINRILEGNNLDFENIVLVTKELIKIVKKKKPYCKKNDMINLISDTCITKILNKYKTISGSIDYMSDSDDEVKKPASIKTEFNEKANLIGGDIALLDYSYDVIKGLVHNFYTPKKSFLLCH